MLTVARWPVAHTLRAPRHCLHGLRTIRAYQPPYPTAPPSRLDPPREAGGGMGNRGRFERVDRTRGRKGCSRGERHGVSPARRTSPTSLHCPYRSRYVTSSDPFPVATALTRRWGGDGDADPDGGGFGQGLGCGDVGRLEMRR
jgi:hypothetical protein